MDLSGDSTVRNRTPEAETSNDLLHVHAVTRGDSREDRCPRAEFDRTVIGHGNMMSAHPFTRQTNVRTVLPHPLVAKRPKRLNKIGAAHIAGKLHVASASSRTKWSLITPGRGPGTPSPK